MQRQFFIPFLAKTCAWTLLAFSFFCGSAALATTAAATQYAADKKLCVDELSSAARLQCRRDAKTAYDTARADEKSKMAGTNKPALAGDACPHCGRVIAVHIVEKQGEGGAVGMIAGGVGGAILGHQIGGGVGKDLATVAGAAGGAYAGKKIEERVRSQKVWTVSVQYPDNSKKHFEFKEDPGYRVGDAVKNAGTSINRR